jgi:hypothetical protein
MFTMKIAPKSVFHPHEAHNLAQLGVMMLYNFFEALKILSFGSKLKGLAFCLTERRMFVMKTSRKFAFHPHETHIHARLNITILYTIFVGFEIYQVSAQNSKGVSH